MDRECEGHPFLVETGAHGAYEKDGKWFYDLPEIGGGCPVCVIIHEVKRLKEKEQKEAS